MESWHPCQVDGGWRIRARVGGQGQHVGWEHFDGEDEEEEDYDGDKQEDDDQDDKDKNDKGEDDNGEQGCRYVVENILMGRTIRKRLKTRRMMMGTGTTYGPGKTLPTCGEQGFTGKSTRPGCPAETRQINLIPKRRKSCS